MNQNKVEAPEEWRTVEGIVSRWGRWYEVSNLGRVRSTGGYGTKTRYMKPFRKRPRKDSDYYLVKLSTGDRGYELRKVSRLVWEAFRGKVQDGMNVTHKDGMVENNRLENLMIVSRNALGEKYGTRSRRRCIVMIDADYVIEKIYTNARAAGADNAMSYQTVLDRCNGKVKKEFALTGYTFRWEDDYYDTRKSVCEM